MLILKTAVPLGSGKLAVKLRSPTSPTASNDQTTQQNGGATYTEGRRTSEAAIDPLSQVCPDTVADIRRTQEANGVVSTSSKYSNVRVRP
jgi:hypothetical protein